MVGEDGVLDNDKMMMMNGDVWMMCGDESVCEDVCDD